MKQAQYSPLSVAEMAFSLLAANEGYLDDIEASQVVSFEAALHSYLNDKYHALLEGINASGDFDDALEAEMKEALDDFKANGAY